MGLITRVVLLHMVPKKESSRPPKRERKKERSRRRLDEFFNPSVRVRMRGLNELSKKEPEMEKGVKTLFCASKEKERKGLVFGAAAAIPARFIVSRVLTARILFLLLDFISHLTG